MSNTKFIVNDLLGYMSNVKQPSVKNSLKVWTSYYDEENVRKADLMSKKGKRIQI